MLIGGACMKRIFTSIFLIIISLITSCGSTNNYSNTNECSKSSSKVSSVISSNNEDIEYHIEKDAISMIKFSSRYPTNNNSLSSTFNLTFKVNLENENTIFEVKCNNVHFRADDQVGNHLFVNNQTSVYTTKLDFNEYIYFDPFIEIIARIDDIIVGYAVICIETGFVVDSYIMYYRYTLLCSKIFPKINGEYQNVSLEYLQNRIDTVKDNTNTISLSDFKTENYGNRIIENYIGSSLLFVNRNFYLLPDNDNAGYEGITYKMLTNNADTKYYCRIDGKGSFSNDEILLNKTISYDEELCWYVPKDYTYDDFKNMEFKDTDILTTFIEIINYEGENIVGFTLLDAFYNGGYYASKKIVSIEFPKINGEYQDISLDYVNERINEIKASCSQTLSI